MRKLITVVLMTVTLFLIPFIKSEAKQDYAEDVILKVGDHYDVSEDYNDDMKVVLILGTSLVCKDGYVYAIIPGTSTVVYVDENGEYIFKRFKVEKSNIETIMLDIGQGDAFLVKVNGWNILVDTGEKKYYEFLKQQLVELEIDYIDTLIVSHMDTDHMGSATLVMQDYGINEVIIPYTAGNSVEYNKFMNYLDRELVNIIYAEKDDHYSLGYGCGLDILSADAGEDTNASSIVMRMSYYDNTFLFTGDAPASVLNQIMNDRDIKVDVLKVPHHGSDTSSPLLFLKNCGADISLISVGRDNAYGHPDDNVIRRLETLGSIIYRTDIDGTVIVCGNGKELSVDSYHIIDWDAENRLKVDKGPIIGNLNSHVYHNDSCMSLPAEKNRIYFMYAKDAETAGYRPCNMCIEHSVDENSEKNHGFFDPLLRFIMQTA